MAFCFGTTSQIAAFFVAYRLANVFRRLFAEGALLTGFVPYYQSIAVHSEKKAAYFFRDLLTSIGLFLILFIAVIEFVFYQTSHLFNADNYFILQLSSIMFPALLFICLFGLSSSLLQCKGKFFLTGLMPIAFNVVWIVCALIVKDLPLSKAVELLAFGILLAYFFQFLFIAIPTFFSLKATLSVSEWLSPSFFSSDVRSLIKPLFAGVIGVGAMQINSALDAVFARAASLEGPAYLTYAIRIQQLPLALFGVAIATALLPILSKKFEEKDFPSFNDILTIALKKTLLLITFCMFGIFSLGFVGINMIYARGDFGALSVINTVRCLWMYGAGLLPMTLVLILAQGFYAQKNYNIPMQGALLSVVINIILNAALIFVFHLGAESIALSTGFAALVNYIYLDNKMKKTSLFQVRTSFFLLTVKLLIIGIISGFITQLVGYHYLADKTVDIFLGNTSTIIYSNLMQQLYCFITLASLYSVSFFVLGICFHITEIRSLLDYAIIKLKKSTIIKHVE